MALIASLGISKNSNTVAQNGDKMYLCETHSYQESIFFDLVFGEPQDQKGCQIATPELTAAAKSMPNGVWFTSAKNMADIPDYAFNAHENPCYIGKSEIILYGKNYRTRPI